MRIPKSKTTKAVAAVAFLSTTNQSSNIFSSTFQKPFTSSIGIAQTSRLLLILKTLSTFSSTIAVNPLNMKSNSNENNSQITIETIDLNSDTKLSLYHYDSVGSTQDTAKLLLQQWKKDKNHFFAVSATEQVNGRGTNGRQWIGAKGNTFVTIAIPMKSIPVPIHLLPLQIGTIIARQTYDMLASYQTPFTQKPSPKINVKWPNDVLIDDNKIAGVLIESDMDHENNIWLLVGIGVNIFYAPAVPLKGKHRGRKATCLKDVWMKYSSNNECTDLDHVQDDISLYIQKAQQMASNLTQDLSTWVTTTPNTGNNNVIKDWKEWAQFGQELTLRDEPGDEKVWTIDIQNDGQLRVKDKYGKERLLVADYLL